MRAQHLGAHHVKRDLVRIDAARGKARLLVVDQLLDELLQAAAVLVDDFNDGFLLLAQRPRHAFAEQLRPFSDGGQRRLQVMGNMAQKTILLLLELRQSSSQPVEPPAEIGKVLRACHRDPVGYFGAADGAYRAIDLLQLAELEMMARNHKAMPSATGIAASSCQVSVLRASSAVVRRLSTSTSIKRPLAVSTPRACSAMAENSAYTGAPASRAFSSFRSLASTAISLERPPSSSGRREYSCVACTNSPRSRR